MSDCPFCPIPEDAEIVAYWGDVTAFVPLNPVTPGHLLIVPEQHVTDLADDPEITVAVARCAAYYVKDNGIGDCNLITSRGPAATQTVGHLHVHIVPRREGDGLALPWTGQVTS